MEPALTDAGSHPEAPAVNPFPSFDFTGLENVNRPWRATRHARGQHRRLRRMRQVVSGALARSPGRVVAEEPGRLVNRLSLPDDLTAHPARPSRRSASSCGTYEVCPAASRARQSASAALSSASSSCCALAACSWACKRRKSSWHACGPARCDAVATAPGCCLIPLESPSEEGLTAEDRRGLTTLFCPPSRPTVLDCDSSQRRIQTVQNVDLVLDLESQIVRWAIAVLESRPLRWVTAADIACRLPWTGSWTDT
jgi:hypothetical protein